MSKPILKVEIVSLGFAGGQSFGMNEYLDLQKEIKNWFEEQDTVYLGGYRLWGIKVLVCEQLDDLHFIPKEEIIVKKQGKQGN